MQSKSNRVFLLVALVLGVLATVTTFAFLESSTSKNRGPRFSIMVAARDLKPGLPLEPEKDLKEMEIPDAPEFAALKDRAVLPSFKGSLKGQKVNRRVLGGTPLMVADLGAIAELQLAGPEMRALSIPAKGANALSGLLVPGDQVKLFVTRPVVRAIRPSATAGETADPPVIESTGKWETVQVLPAAVRVLAVGQKLARSRTPISAAEMYESAAELESQQTVTLEVTEAQAKTIIETSGAGQLPMTLILCPPAPGAGR